MVLIVQLQLCGCVSFLVVAENSPQNENTFLQKILLGYFIMIHFYHGSNLREIIRFLREIECIQFECNEFVLVLVQNDLIHFEHSICISST